MILATGIDIVEVQRIHLAVERWGDRFLRRIFTPDEIRWCRRKRRPELSFAARYVAKEAVLKALGLGLRGGLRWTSVEIVNDELGAPMVRPSRHVVGLIGNKKLLISLSHTREHAVAVALLIDDPGKR